MIFETDDKSNGGSGEKFFGGRIHKNENKAIITMNSDLQTQTFPIIAKISNDFAKVSKDTNLIVDKTIEIKRPLLSSMQNCDEGLMCGIVSPQSTALLKQDTPIHSYCRCGLLKSEYLIHFNLDMSDDSQLLQNNQSVTQSAGGCECIPMDSKSLSNESKLYCREAKLIRTLHRKMKQRLKLWGNIRRILRVPLMENFGVARFHILLIFLFGLFSPTSGKLNVRADRTGYPMPNPRMVSQLLMSARDEEHVHDDMRHTAMLAHWGQFLAHDLSLARESGINCTRHVEDGENCFNIQMPLEEKELPKNGVFPFKRSLSCSDGGHREQLNVITAYVDASMVYGNTQLAALRIRDRFPVDRGRLRENRSYRSEGGKAFLAFDTSGEMACHRNRSKAGGMSCFLSGDPRANEQLMLTSLHTIFLREHNRIASQLAAVNPEWPGETVYHETRKIIGAMVQRISYQEWLPKILGSSGFSMIGAYEGYDPIVNSGIANAVATAALRFGHTMVVSALQRMDPTFRSDSLLEKVKLRDAFFSPEDLIRFRGIDPLIRGSIASPVKDISTDGLLNEELTNHLFPNAHVFPLDLAAMNIQRSRDHALPLYNEWRSLCGLRRVGSWEEMKSEVRDARIVAEVAELYGTPENLDLWVGGLLEKPLRGGKIGRTLSCLIADQFKRLRQGDRLWYENPGGFGLFQLQSIREYSLSKILCNNMDNQTWVPRDSFVFYPTLLRQFVRCSELPDLNLTLWRIEENGFAGGFECSSPDCTCRYQVGRWGECEEEEGMQRRYDLLVSGQYPPCTSQRIVRRPCPSTLKDKTGVDIGFSSDNNNRVSGFGTSLTTNNRNRDSDLHRGFSRRRRPSFFSDFRRGT